MVDPFVVYVFFVVHINHVCPHHVYFVVHVNHNKHMVDPFVVYVFFVVSHKPQMPPPCVFGGFTYTTFASTT